MKNAVSRRSRRRKLWENRCALTCDQSQTTNKSTLEKEREPRPRVEPDVSPKEIEEVSQAWSRAAAKMTKSTKVTLRNTTPRRKRRSRRRGRTSIHWSRPSRVRSRRGPKSEAPEKEKRKKNKEADIPPLPSTATLAKLACDNCLRRERPCFHKNQERGR